MKKNELINCDTQVIVKRLKVIMRKKLDADQSIIYFAGIVYSILLNRNIFTRNDDLKEFVYDIFLKPLGMPQYKDYLYKSRTLLGSRLYRYIIENINYTLTIKISNELMTFFKKDDKEENQTRKSTNEIAVELSKWLTNE